VPELPDITIYVAALRPLSRLLKDDRPRSIDEW
jgi:hypothetical protein